MNEKTKKRLNIGFIVFYFLISVNMLSIIDNLQGWSISIACLIAGLYGVVAVHNNLKFLF